MTTKQRLEVLETKLNPPDDRYCILVIDEKGKWPTKCPRGLELDSIFLQCDICTIRPENRKRMIINWV